MTESSEIYGYLVFAAFVLSALLALAGSFRAKNGPPFFAPKLMITGSGFVLLALVLIMIFSANPSSYQVGLIAAFLFLLGFLLFFIGFIRFCARWGATGKRRAELLELTAALSAMQATQTRTPTTLPDRKNPPASPSS